MNLFFDTSALVKFFHEEKGSDTVTKLMTFEENEIWISEIARIEFLSSLYRRYRNNEVNDLELAEAKKGFDEQISNYNIEQLRQPALEEAENLTKRYGKTEGLRTLDALHLGSFSLISDEEWSFVAADKNLCKVAQQIGYKTINPLDKTEVLFNKVK